MFTKKLSLNKETLRVLSEKDSIIAVAGAQAKTLNCTFVNCPTYGANSCLNHTCLN